jgi:EamA domain-containing membrane protein RarD
MEQTVTHTTVDKSETRRGFLQLHLSVLLAGFTGLFGRLITLNEVDIVWYRMLFTSCILMVFLLPWHCPHPAKCIPSVHESVP